MQWIPSLAALSVPTGGKNRKAWERKDANVEGSKSFLKKWSERVAAEKAKRFIARIFEEYRREPGQLPASFASAASGGDVDRVICDYIAGMTDRFCQDEYKRLFYPFERM